MSALSMWWVRHAPTGARGAIGWSDVPADLSDEAALDAVAARLPSAPIISSDLRRARDTAARLAGPRPRLAPDPALREIHFGAWEGLSFDEIAARDPDLHGAFWERPGPASAPGGESFDAVRARVASAVERITAEQGESEVIIVAHMGAIMAALSLAGGFEAPAALRFVLEPLSITRIDRLIDPQGWRIRGVNETIAARRGEGGA